MPSVRLALVLGASLLGATVAESSAKPAKSKPVPPAPVQSPQAPAPATSAPPAPQPPPLPEPPVPMADALQHGVGCVPLVGQMSRQVLRMPYQAQSAWNRADPASHMFQSVAGLSQAAGPPGDALAAVVAAPTKSGLCDGVTMEVFPLALECAAVEQILLKGGKRVDTLRNVRVMIDVDGKRIFLVPGLNKTCVAVSLNAYFETAPASATPTK